MTARTVAHATFTIERLYPASPARVFAAFSREEDKMKWFSCHEGATYTLDFRVGGRETYRGGPAGGTVYFNETRYHDIVPDRRIVYAYEMYAGDARISVSVVTIELVPEGRGTRLFFTEQGVFLDGHDSAAQREHGTAEGLDKLGAGLAGVVGSG